MPAFRSPFWEPVADRLARYSEPQPNGCVLWTGTKQTPSRVGKGGYGRIAMPGEGRQRFAHRVAYEVAHGVTLERSDVVRHTCDTPLCVNPEHLILGTQADNIRDAIKRGRHVPPPRPKAAHSV